jgi:hypothetical protein
MNTFLQSSSERYPKDLITALIHPLSRADAEIITELISFLKDIEQHEMVAVLNQYKFLKDEEIYHRLLDIHTKLIIERDDETDDDEGGLKPKSKKPAKDILAAMFSRPWIYFKDYRLDLGTVRCYEKYDDYKVGEGVIDYQIIINRLPETTAARNVWSHKVISYDDLERRDVDFALLDSYMSSFPGIKFINERND